MAGRRQLVLMNAPGEDGETPPLGSSRDVFDALAAFNTAPDGSHRATGTETLHGPGYTLEIASGQDVVQQAMIQVHDESIAWPVLSRMCKRTGWKMIDLQSGASFG